jgi:transposase
MEYSVTEIGRAVRRRLERVVRNNRDKDFARRALAVLHLWETGGNVAEAAHRVRAARSSVYRWRSLFETYAEQGLCPQPRGRSDWKASDEVLETFTPPRYGAGWRGSSLATGEPVRPYTGATREKHSG